jgi:protein TonB
MRTTQMTTWVGLSLLLHLIAAAFLSAAATVKPRPVPETVLVMCEGSRAPASAGEKAKPRPQLAKSPPRPQPSAPLPHPVGASQPDAAAQPVRALAATPTPVKPQAVAVPLSRSAAGHVPSVPKEALQERSSVPEPARQRYLKEHFGSIRDLVAGGVVYPPVARRMNWSGRTLVAFTVTQDGGAEDVRVLETSGFPILDTCAVEAVRKAAPFPKPQVRAEIVLPVAFRISR